MSRKFVLPLIAGLFIVNSAFAAPFDSWTELDPRVRAAEEKLMKAQKSERLASAAQRDEKPVRGNFDYVDRTSP